MIDLRNKIKDIINKETENSRFSVLNNESVQLIQQIFNNYEVTHDLEQNFNDLPKDADLIFVVAPTGAGKDSLVNKINHENPDKNYIELNTNFTDIVNSYTLKGLRLHLPNLKDDVKTINPELRISYMDCAALKKFIINNKDYFYRSFENLAVINIKEEYEDFLYNDERINWFIQRYKNSQNGERITQ